MQANVPIVNSTALEYSCSVESQCGDDLTDLRLTEIPCYVGVVSNTLSCLGSVAIVLIYLAWKDLRRKGAQSIVTFLAIADFFTALAYFLGSLNIFIFYENSTDRSFSLCQVFGIVCDIESFVIAWSSTASFLWTLILSFYFYTAIVLKKNRLVMELMPVYHIIAWGLPILILLPLLGTNNLLYAPFVTGVWCYMDIPDKLFAAPFVGLPVWLQVMVKLPELLGYGAIFVAYAATVYSIYKQINQVTINNGDIPSSSTRGAMRANLILVFIPVAFVFLRVWCTVQYFYTVQLVEQAQLDANHCIDLGLKKGHLALAVLQAVGAGGQGWANAILYIFLSGEIRKRLLWKPLKKCVRHHKKHKHKRERVLLQESAT